MRAYLKIYALDFALHNLTQNHYRMHKNHKNQINLCKHIVLYFGKISRRSDGSNLKKDLLKQKNPRTFVQECTFSTVEQYDKTFYY